MFIKIRVFPCSKKEEIIKRSSDSFDVKIREKPEKGLANKAVMRVVSSFFSVPQASIKIIKGGKKRSKILEIK